MEALELPESIRGELRAQLNVTFESARSSGQDLRIPMPQIVEPETSRPLADPGSEPAKDSSLNVDLSP
jgi:hypothetical protein